MALLQADKDALASFNHESFDKIRAQERVIEEQRTEVCKLTLSNCSDQSDPLLLQLESAMSMTIELRENEAALRDEVRASPAILCLIAARTYL